MASLRWIPLLLLLATAAPAQDTAQLARLQLDVRQLQREMATLSQLVNQLRAASDRATVASPPPVLAPLPGSTRMGPAPAATANARWVDASRWQRLKPGMSELDVISELGPPTTVRGNDAERVLLYALEIGPLAFLAGSVTVRDHTVVAVEIPVLK